MRLILFATGILCIGLSSQTDNNIARTILITASVLMVAFAMLRDAASPNRMFPKNTLVLNTTVGASYWFLLLFTCTFMVAVLYSTLYLQVVHNLTPIVAAYVSAAMSFSWTTGALITASWRGRLMMTAVIGGGVLLVISAVGLTLFAINGPLFLIILSLALMGFGIGISNNHVIALTIECAEDGDQSLVASSVQTMRAMGLAFGSAFAGLIANAAGLAEGVEVDVVARAVTLLNIADIALAVLSLGSLLVFSYYYNRDKRKR
jgi:predicted MFS family arabinose efflux permease